MPKSSGSSSVPKSMQATYEVITTLTDDCCNAHLGDEYRALAHRMTAALARKRPSPLVSGQPKTWACAIVYLLGQINFLTDRSQKPTMAAADLCAHFGVGQSTAGNKAKAISKMLNARRMDPEWSLPSLLDRNPLAWMAEVNGFIVDLRSMPREVQELAFDRGMISYIPSDRQHGSA